MKRADPGRDVLRREGGRMMTRLFALVAMALVACTPFEAEEAAAAPAAATLPVDPIPAPKPGDVTTPTPPSSPVEDKQIGVERETLTCAGLAALPADAQFEVQEPAALKATTKDVYAWEEESSDPSGPYRTLVIALSPTTHVCGVRNSNVSGGTVDDQRILVRRAGDTTPAPIKPGTYAPGTDVFFDLETERGTTCHKSSPGGSSWSGIQTALSYLPLSESSKVTITKRTTSWLEGSLDVADFSGKRIQLTFRAPLCPILPANTPLPDVCCAP